MKPYPNLDDEDLPDVCTVLRFIVRERANDVTDWNNLQNTYLSGRSVGKIPTSSIDVAATDKVGDQSFAVDGSYFYILVNASGTARWRRIALGIW